jgi:hypothetical protein
VEAQSAARIGAPRRRFCLRDAMILVAATAVGLGAMDWIGRASQGALSWAGVSEYWEAFLRPSSNGWPDDSRLTILLLAGRLLALLSLPLFAAWTLALIPLRLLGPRPRFRRLARRPGVTAAWATSVALTYAAIQVGVSELISGEIVPEDLAIDVVSMVPMLVGLAVLASWTTLLVGRRWRPEPSWIDRLGRLAGIYWIVAGFAITGLSAFESTIFPCHFYVRHISSP